jgi:hypothetical protein
MFRSYDDWKLATPPEYEEGDPFTDEGEDEPEPVSHVCIELDDRNDPPIL